MSLDAEIRKFRNASADFQKHIRRYSPEEIVVRISQLFRHVEQDMERQRLYPVNELYRVMKWAILQHDKAYRTPKELSEKNFRGLIEEAKGLFGPQLDSRVAGNYQVLDIRFLEWLVGICIAGKYSLVKAVLEKHAVGLEDDWNSFLLKLSKRLGKPSDIPGITEKLRELHAEMGRSFHA